MGNGDISKVLIGKAGRHRWLNKRPTVRGTVMNPVDHPHGGGEGKAGLPPLLNPGLIGERGPGTELARLIGLSALNMD